VSIGREGIFFNMATKKKKPEDVMMDDLSLLRERLRTIMYEVSRYKHLEDMDEVLMKLASIHALLEHIYVREVSQLIRGGI
jgi:hypothetical protein